LSTLVLPLLASAAQGDHEKAPTLGSVTRVQADRSGVSELVLHEQAVVDTTKPGSVTIKGAGRLVGMWLQQQDGPGLLVGYRLPAFAGGKQVTFGSSADCNAPSDDGLSLVPSCGSGPTVLPPGRYTLTVLADGAPLTVTVRAKGVSAGEVLVRPATPLASVQKALPVREDAGSAVTFGDSADLGTVTRTVVLAAVASPAQEGVELASVCRRDDAGTAPLAYGPACTGGSQGGYAYHGQLAGESLSGAGAFASSSTTEHTGPVGLGGSFADSAGVRLQQALGVWLAQD
jgi:hypothetical protein